MPKEMNGIPEPQPLNAQEINDFRNKVMPNQDLKHTPTPWVLILPKHDNDPEYDEDNEDHSRIAIYMGDRLTSPGNFCTANEIVFDESVAPNENQLAQANAAYIVKAVNNHEALVYALECLTREIKLSKLNIRKDFSLINAHACALKALHSLGEEG